MGIAMTDPPEPRYARELDAAVEAARAAAAILAAEFARDGGPRGPDGKCPADVEAERAIRERLGRAFPSYGLEAEEEGHLDREPADPGRHVWVVDPNDGTSHFQRGMRGASVSIALLRADLPVLGVVLAHTAPHGGTDLLTWAEGCGPLRRNGLARPRLAPRGGLAPGDVVLVSPGAGEAALENARLVAPARFRTMPSIAYRLALVAAGEAAAALSLSGPIALDFAAGHALLRGAGGELVNGRGEPVRYGAGARGGRGFFGGPPAVARELAARDWGRVAGGGHEPPAALVWPAPGRCVRDAALLRRGQGALLGQLVGDALGGLAELPGDGGGGVRALRGGGAGDGLAGQPSDDAELALALARALVRAGAWQPGAAAVAYARWVASGPSDLGSTTAAALRPAWAALERGAAAPEIAAVARAAASGESKAGGALARAAPLGIAGWDRPAEEVAAWARDDARLTHPHPVCQDASAVLAAAVAHAVRHGPAPAAVHAHALAVARALGCHPEVLEAVERAALEAPAFANRPGLATAALQNAFFQLRHAPSLEEGVARTVAAGFDGAVAGALLGATQGVDAVPPRWVSAILSCRPIDGAPGVNRPRPTACWPVDALVVAERLLLLPGRS
jgi:fructose-1,6-bisphosphatase/inositol monophosphatase family enzyme/ADP-ribosylglycohydrolase